MGKLLSGAQVNRLFALFFKKRVKNPSSEVPSTTADLEKVSFYLYVADISEGTFCLQIVHSDVRSSAIGVHD